jgi:hypothetical protein
MPDGLYDRDILAWSERQVEGVRYDGIVPRAWPLECPFTLDDLLNERRAVLEERLHAIPDHS